jgi:hypothetical protein
MKAVLFLETARLMWQNWEFLTSNHVFKSSKKRKLSSKIKYFCK